MPYHGTHMMTVAYQIAVKGSTLPIPSDCPSPFSALMQNCWKEKPEERPGFEGILYSLREVGDGVFVLTSNEVWQSQQLRWREEMGQQFQTLIMSELEVKVQQRELHDLQRIQIEQEHKLTAREEKIIAQEQELKRRELALLLKTNTAKLLQRPVPVERSRFSLFRKATRRQISKDIISLPTDFRHIDGWTKGEDIDWVSIQDENNASTTVSDKPPLLSVVNPFLQCCSPPLSSADKIAAASMKSSIASVGITVAPDNTPQGRQIMVPESDGEISRGRSSSMVMQPSDIPTCSSPVDIPDSKSGSHGAVAPDNAPEEKQVMVPERERWNVRGRSNSTMRPSDSPPLLSSLLETGTPERASGSTAFPRHSSYPIHTIEPKVDHGADNSTPPCARLVRHSLPAGLSQSWSLRDHFSRWLSPTNSPKSSPKLTRGLQLKRSDRQSESLSPLLNSSGRISEAVGLEASNSFPEKLVGSLPILHHCDNQNYRRMSESSRSPSGHAANALEDLQIDSPENYCSSINGDDHAFVDRMPRSDDFGISTPFWYRVS